MKTKILLIASIAAFAMLSACEKKTEDAGPGTAANGKEKGPDAGPPAWDQQEPAPTERCEPSAQKPAVVAATGEKKPDTVETIDASLKAESDAAAALREKWRGKTFEEFLPTVKKECFEGGKYIVSGDVAISDIKQLEEFFAKKVLAPPPPPTEIVVEGKKRRVSALIILTEGGEEAAWSTAQKRSISYCVSRNFNNKYNQVVNDMKAAAGEWEAAADVKFVHASQQDTNCTASNAAVVFDVRPVDVGGDYYARAFFPNESRGARNVLIDLSALVLSTDPSVLTLKGVLRHELGHTLGFRHEHTRPQSGTCFEDTDWNPITSYDKFSVMHYPHCNGGADWRLLLTERDRNGAACIYGKAAGFTPTAGMCTPRNTPPLPPDAPTVVNHTNQTVARGKEKAYPPLSAKPGSIVRIRMTGSGASPGDPDLYVNLGALVPRVVPPRFKCRPYLSGATETCELTVGAVPDNLIRYMVRGYAAGSFNLEVTYVPKL